MAALMLYEVILRWFFGQSTMVSTDFSAWAMGILFYWGASKAMDDNTFVRMDIIYDFFKGRFKKIIDIVFDFVILFFNLTITYWFFFMLRNTFARNFRAINIFETPLWIPRLALFIGIVLFNIYLICRIIEDIRAEEQTHSNAELREMKTNNS
jgi:TRAP-type C4-dicarboxylate transport system permease small subunit